MAGFSGAYAINSLSLGRIVTISFGLLWGFIILNIDRQVIYGINSNNSKRTGGFGHTLRSKLGLLLRILLAVTIGFIISEPLKLRLFKSQIERAVALERYDAEIRRLDGVLTSLEEETKNLDMKLRDANVRIDAEVSGTNSFGVPGEGRRYRKAQDQADQIISDKKQNKTRIISTRENLENVKKERIYVASGLKSTSQMNFASNQIKKSTSLDQAQPSTNQAPVPTDLSLFEQIQILWRLQSVANKTSDTEKEQAKKIHEISLVITFLFLVIELLPVFSKLSMGSGVYELLLNEQISKLEDELREAREESELKQSLEDNRRSMRKSTSDHEKISAELEQENQVILKKRYYQDREQQFLARLKAESDLQDKLHEKIKEFKQRVMDRVISKAESNLATEVDLSAKDYADKIALQINDLLAIFEQAYQRAAQKRRPLSGGKADIDSKISMSFEAFEEGIRKVTSSFFDNVRDQTRTRSDEDAIRLSSIAAANMTGLIETTLNEMEQVIQDLGRAAPSRVQSLRQDFGGRLDQGLTSARRDAIDRLLQALNQQLSLQLAELPEATAKLVKQRIQEMINKAVEDLDNPTSPL